MFDYRIPQDQTQGQPTASTSSPSMLPPSIPSEFRQDHHQQQQQQQPHQQQQQQPQQHPYPYGYDSYAQASGSSSFDYASFQRPPMQSGMESMSSPFGNGNGNTSWESPYQGGSSSSQDRINRDPPSWVMEPNGIYGQMGMHVDMSRSDSGPIDANGNGHGVSAGLGLGSDEESWRRNGQTWGNDYGRPAASVNGTEQELENLRSQLHELVEGIRPHATTSSNPRPPRAHPYAQQRFVRLAATIQATLATLQPHMNPLLNPDFVRTPPKSRLNIKGDVNGHGLNGSSQPLTAAEEEMEVIKKRRDMLIARAAQVSASHHQQPPQPVEHPTSFYPSHQQPMPSPPQQHLHLHQSQHYQQSPMHAPNLFSNWGQTDLYAPGATLFNVNPLSMSLSTSANGSPFGVGAALSPFDDNTMVNSRRSTDAFDGGLARFSLDPAKISYPEKIAKKPAPEGGQCHGCSATVTAEWRRGPDGPRSLCNACGLHYAKLTRKRAQEEALNRTAQAN